MRRRDRIATPRSSFALWLDSVNCQDPEWLERPAEVRRSGNLTAVVALWRAWPSHRLHQLWWAK